MKEIGYPSIKDNKFDVLKFWLRRYTSESYDIVLSPNAYTDEVFMNAFQISKERLMRGGYPRNLAMFLNVSRRQEIRRALFRNPNGFIWLYLPTHRNEGKDADSTKYGYEQVLSLRSTLEEHGIEVAFQPHFYEDRFFNDIESRYAVYRVNIAGEFSLYEVLGAADGLITDYSSVAFDYCEISENIVIFDFDQEDFRAKHRGLTKLPADDFRYCAKTSKELKNLLIQLSTSENCRSEPKCPNATVDLLYAISHRVGG